MLGSQCVAAALKRRGVTTIFSLSGNQIMPIYDACIDAQIRIVHVRHEAAAVFMADAWTQVTGEIGVALVTAGPGVANAVGPLFSVRKAESAVLLLSGDSALSQDGTGAFQELDQVTMTRSLTKQSRRVCLEDNLASTIDEAISVALAPRRGPVHIVLPFDLLTRESSATKLPTMEPPAWKAPLPEADVACIARLLSRAQRPLVLVGPADCRVHRRDALLHFSEAHVVPVIAMQSPRGLRDPSLGSVAERLAEADLVILAGKSLDFTLGFGQKVFHRDVAVVVIDLEPEALKRAQYALGASLRVSYEADAAIVLDHLTDFAPRSTFRSEWLAKVAASQADRSVAIPTVSEAITPLALCQAVQREIDTDQNTILICDGGEFGQWAQAFCTAPTMLINGVSGAIGGSLCYAIAAKIARPDARVIALQGDGTAGFHLAEFDTAVREGTALTIVIGNDLRWNAEHLIQLRSYGAERLTGCTLSATARYEKVAEALGGFGVAVEHPEQLEALLRLSLESGRPACVNVAIEGQAAPDFVGHM